VLAIEPFETSLRENTPLTSIGDPNALVEYLNQVNLKGDMVLDELKRVSSERDIFKQRLIEAENSTSAAWDEVADLRKEKPSQGKPEALEEQVNGSRSTNEDEQKEPSHSPKSPTTSIKSIKSPTLSLPGMSMFSPKPKAMELPQARQGSEDLFSYDGEVPRLETALEAKDKKIQCLETDVMSLKTDLAVTRESTQSMVQTLEEATREVNALRESRDRADLDAKEQQSSLQKLSERLRADLQTAEEKVQQLEAVRSSQDTAKFEELSTRLQDARQELERLQSVNLLNQKKEVYAEGLHRTINTLEGDLSSARKECQQHEKKAETLNSLITNLRSQLANAESKNEEITSEIESSSAKIGALKQQIEELNFNREAADQVVQFQGTSSSSGQPPQPANPAVGGIPDVASTNKKKNKKKKKGAKSGPEQDRDQNESKEEIAVGHSTGPTDSEIIERLQQDLKNLQNMLEEKDAAIDKAQAKLKNQDVLREEIDLLRDNLVDVGQEHVETKDKVKELVAEKTALETTVTSLEEELANLRGAHESTTADSEQRHRDLAAQFEDLKVKATSLQTDLSAAQQLASTRFKDLNDLRSILQKAQPEISSLRTEAAAMKSTREALGKKEAEFKILDSRHEEMRSDVTKLKQTIAARETEIKTLKHTASQEMSARSKAEEANSKAQQDMGRVEAEKRQATESLEKLSRELNKSREQLASHKAQLKEVEQQFSKHRSDSEGLKEEIDLKSAQYASAQSLMASMRDQTAEMAIQMKEARDRCDSLDEEVADAHRLLSERSREGETMRRLLADVEGRADARTREMKERMDSAIEERDRAEEEASTVGRRRARELEDIRSRYHDVERSLKRAEDDKEELEVAQRDWKKRREELEHRASHSSSEVDEVRKAMSELRDALDESEKQARDLEKQKAELRRSVEETQNRLEKLQKSNKVCCLHARHTKRLLICGHSPWRTKSARFKWLEAKLWNPKASLRARRSTQQRI